MIVSLLVVFGLLGVAAWWWLRNRKTAAPRGAVPVYILVHTQGSTVLEPAVKTATGTYSIGGAEYPPSLLRPVENGSPVSGRFYTLGLDAVALHTHQELERVRFGVLVGSIFKPAGDMVETSKLIAAALVIAAAVFMWSQVGSINNQLAQQAVMVKAVQEKLNQPLQVLK